MLEEVQSLGAVQKVQKFIISPYIKCFSVNARGWVLTAESF